MDRVANYLFVPKAYGRWLGGLRWSSTGDAVEYEDGETFAFSNQVGLFLEGFTAERHRVHFAHALHLLRLLGYGKDHHAAHALLTSAFVNAGRPLRNAGVLCARLCAGVPPVADPLQA